MTDIDRIKELLPTVSPAPWDTGECSNGGLLLRRPPFDGQRHAMQSHLQVIPHQDAEFIALCRNNIAALIEAIEKAPHGYRCTSDFSDLPNPEDCDCWKAEALGKRS